MGQHCMKKAAEIAWKHTSKYANIILQMGTFHTIMTLLAIIGKRFQDAGLRDTCTESGIIANGSVSGVLEGRMYSWAARVHTIIHEALLRLAWKGFITWLETLTPPPQCTQSVHCLIKSAMHVKKFTNRSLTNYSQVMVWQSR